MKYLSVYSALNRIETAVNLSREHSTNASSYNEYQSDCETNGLEKNESKNKNFDKRKSSSRDPYEAYAAKSLFCLTKKNILRKFCLRLITSPWFERVSICVILMNCVTLGMYKPCEDNPCQNSRCQITQYFDLSVYAFFIVELIIKVIAMAFYGKNAYLSETWNRLDLFIIIAGTIEYSIATENLSLTAIRTVRVLRPLRAINRVPSMRILVMLLLDTLPMLGNVFLLCASVFLIFGILGVQLWKGTLRNRCFFDYSKFNLTRGELDHLLPYDFYKPPYEDDYICTKSFGMSKCEKLPPFVNNSRLCKGSLSLLKIDPQMIGDCINWNQYYTSCESSQENPFKGAISFDNIGAAEVAIFQIVSLENWVSIMYFTQDANSFWTWLYFVFLIVIGSFIMINLCLVVIATQFAETKKRETDKILRERFLAFGSQLSLNQFVENGSFWEELVNLSLEFLRNLFEKLSVKLRKTQAKGHLRQVSARLTWKRLSVPSEGDFKSYRPSLDMGHSHSFNVQAPQATPDKFYIFDSYMNFPHASFLDRIHVDPDSMFGSDILEITESAINLKFVEPRRSFRVQVKKRVSIQPLIISFKNGVNSKYFDRAILLAILINTITMGIEHHNQPETLTQIVEYSNLIFSTVFFIEMICKLMANGLISYIKNGYNVFDGTIVIISIYELYNSFNDDTQSASGVSVLRTFRLLRLLKLVRFMPSLRKQLILMLRAVNNVATFFSVLILFMFIFSILGMNLFGCKFCEYVNDARICERKNFDSLLWSFMTVFQILTQDDWNEVLYNGMNRFSPLAALYFILLMTFGNYILFNLLLAILVEGFSLQEGEKKKIEMVSELETRALSQTGTVKILSLPHTRSSYRVKHTSSTNLKRLRKSFKTKQPYTSHDSFTDLTIYFGKKAGLLGHDNRLKRLSKSHTNITAVLKRTQSFASQLNIKNLLGPGPSASVSSYNATLDGSCLDVTSSVKQQENCTEKIERPRKYYSLWLFSPKNRLRILCKNLIGKPWFDSSMLVIIGVNCFLLALERPSIRQDSLERFIIDRFNFALTIIFICEMMIKVIANGFILDKESYLRIGWNVLDGTLVLISILDILVLNLFKNNQQVNAFMRLLRMIKTLKPLRIISRTVGLKLVVQTLLNSLLPIGNIVLISFTFFVIFGILGVQLFKGKFFHCVGENLREQHIRTRDECLSNLKNQWVNSQYNFDNLGNALIALFVLSSKDGWVQIMYNGIDAVGVDREPIENYNEWMILYFIAFVLLVGFIVLNMFVGVVVENFHQCWDSQEIDEKEMQAKKKVELLIEKRRQRMENSSVAAYSRPRQIIYNLCKSKYFELVSASLIGINVFIMAFEYYMMPSIVEHLMEIIHFIFSIVFILEALMRVLASGFKQFIKEKWNQVDLFIIVVSFTALIYDKLNGNVEIPINPTLIRVVRVIRITRALKLLKMADGIRSLIDTVIQALPEVGNLSLLFFLLYFIFSSMGVELFGKLNCEIDLESRCDGINKHAHFHNFGMSFLTLFRIATGDNWNGIMRDALKNKDLCKDENGQESSWFCLAHIITPLYFVFFILMAQFVLINVVVAVLLKRLDDSNKTKDDDAKMEYEIERQLEEEDLRNKLFKDGIPLANIINRKTKQML